MLLLYLRRCRTPQWSKLLTHTGNRPDPFDYKYRSAPETHISALDGLRGVAILLVLSFHVLNNPTFPHAWGRISGRGWVGVDLFFVLSGFLITGILLRSRDTTNYFSTFYLRRFLRIAPVYYLWLFLILIVIPWMHRHFGTPSPASSYTFQQQILYWLNLSNLRSAFFPLEIGLASIYWSLAVEEQFYAVWPLCVRLLKPQRVATVCITGLLVSPLLRMVPLIQRINYTHGDFIYRFTPFRLDGFFMGAVIAQLLTVNLRPRRFGSLCLTLFIGGVALFFLTSHAPPKFGLFAYTAQFSAHAAIFGGLVGMCAQPAGIFGRLISRLCSISVLRVFGKYSYCLYVTHLTLRYFLAAPAMLFAQKYLGFINPFLFVGILTIFASLLVSALSWRHFEAPILRLKRFAPYRTSTPLKVQS
jgi:peptidoglycan/LPS O-acetylase OafA/YrhL